MTVFARVRRDWRLASGHHIQHVWDHVVAFLIPGRVYSLWMRFVYDPLRYGAAPWGTSSSCDTCPICQVIERERRKNENAV